MCIFKLLFTISLTLYNLFQLKTRAFHKTNLFSSHELKCFSLSVAPKWHAYLCAPRAVVAATAGAAGAAARGKPNKAKRYNRNDSARGFRHL